MYVIVTDESTEERMYLAWAPGNGEYFWTSKHWFDTCRCYNAPEHWFMFHKKWKAQKTLRDLNIPESWKAKIVKLKD